MTVDVASLHERLAASLAATPPDLLRGDDAASAVQNHTLAAVLIAVVDRVRPALLLTVRTDTLRHHAGQIAFPGGRAANEEVGLDPSRVRIIGCADPYRTVTGFAVTPVVGIIPPDLPLVARDGEVAELFEVPLDFATDPANHVARTMDWQGERRRYFEIACGERRVWGATAAIIINLARRMGSS